MNSENQGAKNTLFSGSMLMLTARMIVKSIGLVSSIILARLLIPEDFGLVAIAMALYGFVELFGAFGLSTVLIQKQTKSKQDYDTAWTFKVLFGTASALVMILAAPFLATFYDDARLVGIVYVIALLSILSGAQNIGVIEFQKDMDFQKELKFMVIPKILSFAITITLAFTLGNYWALVLGMLSNHVISLIYSYLAHPFRPGFSLASLKTLFHFSKWLLLNNLLTFLGTRMTNLLIARVLSPAATGLYSIGNEIASLPTTEVAAPINKASFPLYSKFSDNKPELKAVYLNTLAMIAAITIPASMGLALVAPLFVEVVLGEKWLGAVVLMQWIAIASLIFSLTTNNTYVYLACGRPKISFYISLTRVAVFLPLLVWLLNVNGLVGAGQAMLITAVVMLLVTQTAIGLFIKIGVPELIKIVYRPVAASAAMYYVVSVTIGNLVAGPTILALLMVITAGGLTYLLSAILLWYIEGMPEGFEHDILQTLKNRLKPE